jgi:hypothetical protein
MIQWHKTNVPGSAINFSLLGSIPIELDPHWLNSRINSPDKYVQYFIQGDQYHPCGYAPFFVHPGKLDFCFGEITLASISVNRYAIQGAPLCEDYSSLAELFKCLSKCLRERIDTSNVVFFEGVVTGSALDKLLTETSSLVFNSFHVVPFGPTYERRLIELTTGAEFKDYLQTLGSHARTNLRHAIKKFKTMTTKNTVKVTCYTEPEQADELINILTQISRKTYQHHLLNLGFKNNPEQLAELRATASGGWLRAYVLWIDEAPVAFNIGYHHGHTFYGHNMGYDPEFSKLQPGIYLLAEVIADLLSNSIYCLDFLSGDSVFKRRLSNKSREERHYYLIPRGWPGTAYAFSLSSMNFLSTKVGDWLDKKGLKSRIKRLIRDKAVTKVSAD